MNEEDKNFWSIYIGQALTDRNVPPATVIVTDTFHKCLLSGNPDAWRMLVVQSEKFIQQRNSDENKLP